MKIKEVINCLEVLAHPSLQESYDNAGLITGSANTECTGIICTLDATEDVIAEAISKKCNLVVAHHPIVFSGLKKINGKNYVERVIIAAIKNDIAIYAIHTNLDNVLHGVNGKIASLLGIINTSILNSKENTLKKMYTFVPTAHTEAVRSALFAAGAGSIGRYNECSFSNPGMGTFKASECANPFVGEPGKRHTEPEEKLEVIFPGWLQPKIVTALKEAHPYEEVAYDIVSLANTYQQIGAGVIGDLPEAMEEKDFLHHVKTCFGVSVVKHTAFINRPIKKVAVCGGAGSFLIFKALAAGADVYITADLKYHEFFDADGRMLLIDVGHYESEQYTIELLQQHLGEKFPTFAVLKTAVKTNPVRYF